jgi:hypothetical protein
MSEPQVALLARETRSSIELTRNARGDYQWVMKVYFEEGHAQSALAVLSVIDDELRARYLPAETEEE